MALTLKKRLYADALMAGANQTDAAIAAGCPEKTAAAAGSRYAKDPDILKYIKAKNAEEKQRDAGVVHVKRNVADPRDALLELLNDPDPKIVLSAASTLMPYFHAKVEASGKKETAKTNAKSATTSGRFSTLNNQTTKIQ